MQSARSMLRGTRVAGHCLRGYGRALAARRRRHRVRLLGHHRRGFRHRNRRRDAGRHRRRVGGRRCEPDQPGSRRHRRRHPPNQQSQRVRSSALLGVLQRDGQRRCGPCRMHHHRGVLHGSCCAARSCRHDPGAFFPAGHTAGRGEHVRAVTIRLPGRDLQSSRHRGGPTMSRRNTRQARSRFRSRVAVIVAGAALLSWAGPGANAFWSAVLEWRFRVGRRRRAWPPAQRRRPQCPREMSRWHGRPAATLAGRPVSGYAVARYASASGGTKIAAGGTCTGTVTAGLGCTDQGVPTGTWYYTVTPVLGQWQRIRERPERRRRRGHHPADRPHRDGPHLRQLRQPSRPCRSAGTTEPGASIALTVTDAGLCAAPPPLR